MFVFFLTGLKTENNNNNNNNNSNNNKKNINNNNNLVITDKVTSCKNCIAYTSP